MYVSVSHSEAFVLEEAFSKRELVEPCVSDVLLVVQSFHLMLTRPILMSSVCLVIGPLMDYRDHNES